jgi:hypothetical protein
MSSSYRAVNTFHLGYKKTDQFMLYVANVAIWSKKNAKHINIEWQNVKFLIIKPVCVLRNQ